MSSTRFFNSNVFHRIFSRKESLIDSRAPVAKLSSDVVSIIRDWLNDDCLLTLDDISHRLSQRYGILIGHDKIACCFNDLHFSIERSPTPKPLHLDEEAIVLLRKVFADDFIKFANRINLFSIGTTKVTVNNRVFQGKKASPQWAVKSKTFTLSAALRPDKLYDFEIQDASYTHKESPSNSPDRPDPPVKFIDFFRKFMNQLEADGIKNAIIVMDGPCYNHVLREDSVLLLTKKQEHRIYILPANSADFSPLENLFDSLRYHVEKFNPTDPESVFNALKRLPESVTDIECSYYFDDSLNIIKGWSEMLFD